MNCNRTIAILPQKEDLSSPGDELTNINMNETLALADDILDRHNKAWARFLVTDDHRAYWEALTLADDRAALLEQVGGGA